MVSRWSSVKKPPLRLARTPALSGNWYSTSSSALSPWLPDSDPPTMDMYITHTPSSKPRLPPPCVDAEVGVVSDKPRPQPPLDMEVGVVSSKPRLLPCGDDNGMRVGVVSARTFRTSPLLSSRRSEMREVGSDGEGNPWGASPWLDTVSRTWGTGVW